MNPLERSHIVVFSFKMLSLMEAQAQFFQHGHQSLSELDEYRRTLSEEVSRYIYTFHYGFDPKINMGH